MIKESVVLKYLSGKASQKEVKELLKWVEASSANKREFLMYKKIWAFSTVEEGGQERIWRQVQFQIKNHKRNKRRRQWYYAAAASIIGFSMLTVFFNQKPDTIYDGLPDNQNEIVLELEDGTKTIINATGSNTVTHNGVVVSIQKGQRIQYSEKSDTIATKKLGYNILYVPFGKRFTIELSDGTVVDLNSGSRLKYPVQFPADTIRQVFLEGEAYFDVTKSKEQAFVVNSDNLKTSVYGTQFNITSYPSNDIDLVVLVEGRIGVSIKTQEETLIAPNELVSINKQNGAFSKSTVDIKKYIAWKEGVLWFDAEPFDNIIRTLERHYDVIIVNKLDNLNTIKFTGTFENNESVEEILEVFADYKSFKFKKENNLITIY